MTIQQLNYVITISEKGSLNKAAEVLYVTQPSLTSAVRELEKELGITIFNRGGKGVTLTNDGAEFIQYARQVVNQYDRLLENMVKAETCGRNSAFPASIIPSRSKALLSWSSILTLMNMNSLSGKARPGM